MECLECGLEQAVADARTCALCGAPLADAGHPSRTFTGRDGAELRLGSRGITVRKGRDDRARLLGWEEISWFRDGWHVPEREKPGWVLDIVLAGGRVEHAVGIWGPGEAAPKRLALIRRAAAAHSIPAVLTGGRVHGGLPGKDAGLYYDPAGEPGLREWTGTEWSPFLQVDPVTSGHPGQENGLARIWSPLPAAELQRQSRAILRETWYLWAGYAAFLGGPALVMLLIAVLMVTDHLDGSASPGMAAFLGTLSAASLTAGVFVARWAREQKKTAKALRAAATLLLAQDDPPASTAPPDLRTT